MDLKPVIVANPHPLVGDGRKYSYVTFLKGETLGEYLQRTGFDVGRGPKSVYVNGQRVPDDKWHLLLPETGDQIVIRTRATGGGNGGKVLRVVAMVALTIISAGYGAALGGALGFTGTTAAAVGSSLIMIGGSMIINALLPPPKASMTGVKEKEHSPTYGINAGNNSYNSYGPMIVVFGKHKVVPYFASKPYTTFQGNDQFLSQAFHFGLQPDLDLQAIRIGSTDISNYRDVQINRSTYDGKLNLVSGNVDTLDGFELAQGDGWIQRTTPRDTQHISIDVAARLFHINDRGDEGPETVVYETQYKSVTSSQWLPIGGEYSERSTNYWSLGRWTTEETIFGGRQVWQQVQYGSTDPYEHTEGEPMEICHEEFVYLKGFVRTCETYFWRWITYGILPWQGRAPNPIKKILGTGISELTGSDPQKPTRVTLDVAVLPGQYDVRIRKTTEDISTSRSSNKLAVTQIRCTQVDNADYTGQCRLAVRIKATSQLNGTIDQLSAIASAKTYIWKNNAWVKAYTSNPAWWYLMWARGMRDNSYNRLYGECLPDSKIDLEAIKSWAAWCDEKGLTFNWVLDRKMSIDDVYHVIARAGRASKTMHGGKLSVIWDSADIPESNFCTPDNIIAGSFQYSYINTEVADEIIVNFHNEQKDYEPDVVRQKVPGAVQINNPITLDLEGCTVASQAGREANLLAASQYFHRRQYSWEMDIEGATITRGDVVRLTHDLTSWGASGRIMAYEGGRITLDSYIEPIDNAWMAIRSPNNKIAHIRVSPVVDSDGDQVYIVGGWPRGEDGHDLIPRPDGNEIDYIWQYSPTETPGRKVQIKSVRPAGGRNVKFEAIDYLREYHESENNAFIHIPTGTGTKALINVFSISASELIIEEVSGRVQVTFTWVLSEKSNSEVHLYVNRASFDSFNTDRYMTSITAVQGDVIDIEVRPTKEGRGLVEHYQYKVNGTLFKIPAIQSLTTASEIYGIRLNWTIPTVNYIERTEVWYSEQADRNSAQKLTDLAYPQQEYRQSGIRAGQVFFYWVRLVDRFGNVGPFYPAGDGIRGASSTDVKEYCELFKNEFLDSEVGKRLIDDIDIIRGDDDTPGSIAAAVKAESLARDEDIGSLARQINTVQAGIKDVNGKAEQAIASAQTNSEAIVEANGRMSSVITQKVQILENGQRVFAGTGLGIESAPNGEGFQSSYNVWAERFAVWSGTGTELFSPFVVSKGQVFINDAIIGKLAASKIDATNLSAISSNLGVVSAGIISMDAPYTEDGWSYIRSGNDKWWGDNIGGFFLGKNTKENSRWFDFTAGGCRLRMFHNVSTNRSGASLRFATANDQSLFYVDDSGYMRVDAVDVMGTLQLRGNAVTTHVSGYRTSTVYINAPLGGILTVFAYKRGDVWGPTTMRNPNSQVDLRLYVGGKHRSTDSATRLYTYANEGNGFGTQYFEYTPSLNIQWSGWVSGNGIEINAPGATSIVAFLAVR